MTPQALSLTLADLAPALKNHLWQSTLFLLAAALLTLALRRNHARTRYWLWLAASIKFLIPFALLITLGSHLATPRAAPPPQTPMYFAMEEVSQPFTPITLPIAAPAPPAKHLTHLLAILIAAIWLIGFLTVLTIWFIYWRRIATILRTSIPIPEGRELEVLRRLESRPATPYSLFPTPSPIQLLLSPSTLGPGIYGIARPILIWPEGISHRLSDAHLESVLAHEICHVRRRDNLTAALHMLVEAIFWFHPLVWILGARLEAERERACDETVLALATHPHIYAESILKICEFYIESPLPCVSGVTGSDLKQRLTEILDKHATLKLTLAKKFLLTAAALLAIAVPILSGQARAMRRLSAIIHAPSPLLPFIATAAPEQTNNAKADAQDTPTPDATTGPAFEVATIRPARRDDGRQSWSFGVTPSGRFTVSALSLNDLVGIAYDGLHEAMPGGLKWTDSEYFAINAKVGDADTAGWDKLTELQRVGQVRPMVRTLLAERFHLKLRTETRDTPVYALLQAKGGAKLKPADLHAAIVEQQSNGAGDPAPGKATPGDYHLDGNVWTGNAVSMDVLASVIRNTGLDRMVVDETGLKGNYDFTFTLSRDKDAPTIFQQVEDQLGLKLDPRKVPIKTLIIESADKPSLDGAELSGQALPTLKSVAFDQETPTPLPAANTPYIPTLTFDVASVREAKVDYNAGITVSGSFTPHTTNFHATNWSILNLVASAYRANSYQISGIPADLQRTVFNVQARSDSAADETIAKLDKKQQQLEQQHLLQGLLADRFNLKVHWETRQGDVYNLVITKGGSRLRFTGEPPSAEELKNWGDHPIPPLYQHGDSRREFDYTAHACQMQDIIDLLTGQFGRPVIDKTGLTGKYDFVLKTHDTRVSDRRDDDPSTLPTLETAIQDQLGLKLEPAKGPAQFLVIDHIEKPSEN
jgi:bla regulator protein blaR1